MENKRVDNVVVQKESKNIEVDKQELVADLGHKGLDDLHGSKENGHCMLSKSRGSLETAFYEEQSLTDFTCKEVPGLKMTAQSLTAFKNVQSKENELVHLKVQNFSKTMIAQFPANYRFLQTMRHFEDDGFGYESGHDSGSSSSFEFHKGNKESRRSVLGLFSKSVPSKWDDAEKWLVNHSCANGHVIKKLKPPADQSQAIPAHSSRKVSIANQLEQQSSITKAALPNASVAFSDHMTVKRSLHRDEGETKKIDTELASMRATSCATAVNTDDSLNFHPVEDVFSQTPHDQKEINDSEACLKTSLQSEKSVANSAILSKNDLVSSMQSAVLYTPPPTTIKPVSTRDMGTEMTPIASQEPSTIGSPIPSQQSTPGRGAPASLLMEVTETERGCREEVRNVFSGEDLQTQSSWEVMGSGTQLWKANNSSWPSKEEEEGDASKSLKAIDLEEAKRQIWEARATAWEEAEHAKYIARYKQEEAKIQAWENQQKAKAESEMRRLEVKVERMKSHAHEKLLYKLAALQQQAEQKLATAQARQNGQATKITQRADYVRRTGRIPTPFFCWRFCF